MKEVVLIRLAAGTPSQVDVEQLRDYVVESINMGVLVLGAGAEISVMELPEPMAEELCVYQLQEPQMLQAEYAPEPEDPREEIGGGRTSSRGRPP